VGEEVGATGLASNPTEYRRRLGQQTDEQLDAWAAELMRDVARRRGVVRVLADFRKAARLDEAALVRVFARGGGAPATAGRDAGGQMLLPAVALHFLVPGLRAEVSDARVRLIDYLAANFHEIVYI
jgi:hypothetical protein